MAEKAASGRQLFFDLIAAAGESQAPSAFESAAWAVAAEHPLAQDRPGRTSRDARSGFRVPARQDHRPHRPQ